MSYSTDLIQAKNGWWVVIKHFSPDQDIPDPIQPHPFTDAVNKMDGLMAGSYCYKSEGIFGNIVNAQKEFYEITNSEDITKFLQYWATLIAKAKEDIGSTTGKAKWGLCLLGVAGNVQTVKRYVAAYLSKNLNLKYSLVVLAIEGVHKKYHDDEHTNLFKELYDTIQPDSSLVGDWRKTAQLAVMALAFAYPGTEMNNDSWVNFMAAIKTKRVPKYCLLEGEVEKPEPPPPKPQPGGGGFPWLIVILVVLAAYMLYYYNKNS